jgi:hypothetical protein
VNAEEVRRRLAAVDVTPIASWDNRKTLLDIYYDGENADYVADANAFTKRYAGLIAVADWAARKTLDYAGDEFPDPARQPGYDAVHEVISTYGLGAAAKRRHLAGRQSVRGLHGGPEVSDPQGRIAAVLQIHRPEMNDSWSCIVETCAEDHEDWPCRTAIAVGVQ